MIKQVVSLEDAFENAMNSYEGQLRALEIQWEAARGTHLHAVHPADEVPLRMSDVALLTWHSVQFN
jgi:hypothetical protein